MHNYVKSNGKSGYFAILKNRERETPNGCTLEDLTADPYNVEDDCQKMRCLLMTMFLDAGADGPDAAAALAESVPVVVCYPSLVYSVLCQG